MTKTPVAALITTPNQKFVYEYDPAKLWTFLVELIGIERDENPKKQYPVVSRREGVGPAQYGVTGLPGKTLEVEEAYDLSAEELAEGFSSEGGEEGAGSSSDDGGGDE